MAGCGIIAMETPVMLRRCLALLLLALLPAIAAAEPPVSPQVRMELFSEFEDLLLLERADLLDREAAMADPIWVRSPDTTFRLYDGARLQVQLTGLALFLEEGGLSPSALSLLPLGDHLAYRAAGAGASAEIVVAALLNELRGRSPQVRTEVLGEYDALLTRTRAAFQAALGDREAPGLPPVLRHLAATGIHDCSCFSSDGRNGACRDNGCAPPPNFSGICFWTCVDAENNQISFHGVTGVQGRWP